jgi:cation transport regulator ChaC
LAPDAESEVWGVLYKVARRDLLRLDSTEGVPGRGYQPQWFEAEDRDGRVLSAVAYIARGSETDGTPSLRYLTLLREGARANGLPGHWLQFLDRVEHAK